MKRRLIGLVFLSLAVLIILLSGTLVWQLHRGPNTKSTNYITQEAEAFLGSSSVGTQAYSIVKVGGPVDDWVLITLARVDHTLGEDTGSEGAVAIGHFTNTWKFTLQEWSETFNLWLDQLPEELLELDLRDHFRVYDQETDPPPGYNPSRFHRLAVELMFYLPYPAGKRYKVTTLPRQFHHQGSIKYAIDFDMPEGYQIAAAASGEVIGLKDDSNRGGCSERYAGDANFIRIKIAPSESILYLHSQVNSISEFGLRIGSEVKAGQIIAKSGSTGFTCNWRGTGPGAHLHIIREKWCGNRICGSLPLYFVEFGGEEPRTGIYYVSANLSVQERGRAERERQEREEVEIKRAVDNFLIYYSCAKTVGCYDLAIPEAKLVTKNVRGQLVDELTSCFGCTFFWDEHTLESLEYLNIPRLDSGTVLVRTKQQWQTVLRSDTYTHFSVVVINLVKEGSIWKTDSWKLECGYVLKGDGEVVHSENLEGCPWQPVPLPTPTNSAGN